MKSKNELGAAFNPVHQPVVVTCGSTVVFSNPAAKAALGAGLDSLKPQDIFPAGLFSAVEEGQVSAAEVLGKYFSISVTCMDELKIFFLSPISMDANALGLTRHMVGSMRSSAMGLKMAADRLLSDKEQPKLNEERYVSAFYHYYYSLSRTLSQIDSADLIKRTELPFSPSPTDLVKLCRELTDTVALLCVEKEIDISFVTSEEQLIVMADGEKLESLILNLFSNSLHHTTVGDSVTLGLSLTGESVIISMDDNGEGISEETLQKLFRLPENELSMADAALGTGLGIYIALGIAKLHGGTIMVESRKGEGAHFRVTLPYSPIPEGRLGVPQAAYRTSGMSLVLTGLADVLGTKSFGPKFED